MALAPGGSVGGGPFMMMASSQPLVPMRSTLLPPMPVSSCGTLAFMRLGPNRRYKHHHHQGRQRQQQQASPPQQRLWEEGGAFGNSGSSKESPGHHQQRLLGGNSSRGEKRYCSDDGGGFMEAGRGSPLGSMLLDRCWPPRRLSRGAGGGLGGNKKKEKRRGGTTLLRAQADDDVDGSSSSKEGRGLLGSVLRPLVSPMVKALEQADIGLVPTSAYLAQAALIGLLTGLSIITFKTLISTMETYTYGNFLTSALNAFGSGRPLSLAMAAIPALGGGIVACIRELVKEFPPGLSGQIDDVEKQRPLDVRRSVCKTLSAVATLGSGCSLGPEGPAVEIGATCSRLVSWGGSVDQRLKLLAAGAAAGVAAGFNAPIAGVFFALEIAQGSSGQGGGSSNVMQKSSLAAVLLSAVISALVARVGLKEELALRPAPYLLQNPLVELPAYLGLGFLSGVVALTFKYFLARSDDFFKGKTPYPPLNFMANVPRYYKPVIGGAICGVTGIVYPPILFFGYETLDGLIANQSYEAPLLVTLLLLKGVMTAICLGSGLVGGLFAPSLFLGATAGASYQKLITGVLSLVSGGGAAAAASFSIAGPPAYAMVGAAAVLASMFRAPLTGSLLLFELTRDYDILLPLMASAGMGSLLVELVERKTMAKAAAAAAAAAASSSTGGEAGPEEVLMVMMEGGSDEGKEEEEGEVVGGGGAMGAVMEAIKAAAAASEQLQQMSSSSSDLGSSPLVPLTSDGSSVSRGGILRSDNRVLLYELTAKDALMRDALSLPPHTPLEDALVQCCMRHCQAVLVVQDDSEEEGGEEEEGGGGRLLGVASIRELTTALERWFEEAATRVGSATTDTTIPPALASSSPFLSSAGGDDGVGGGAEEALGTFLQGLQVSTGLTIAEACGIKAMTPAATGAAAGTGEAGRGGQQAPSPPVLGVLASDPLAKARDMMMTRSLTLLPVYRDERRGQALGVVGLDSIDKAAKMREAVDIVSRSLGAASASAKAKAAAAAASTTRGSPPTGTGGAGTTTKAAAASPPPPVAAVGGSSTIKGGAGTQPPKK